jgi:acetyl-CoA C-acetyltransferase
MGLSPVPAVQNLLAKSGIKLSDFELIELNEAFAPSTWDASGSWG